MSSGDETEQTVSVTPAGTETEIEMEKPATSFMANYPVASQSSVKKDDLFAVSSERCHTHISDIPKITEPEVSASEIEKKEEAKLRAKYPRQISGQSAFLHRRLQKGQKFFDSGDYQMAQQGKGKVSKMPPLLAQKQTGEAIPTPDTVPARKTSIIQNKLPTTQLT